ncbi:MAG: DUF1552 domain-containing protein [Myxococcota bacterium]
MFKDFKHSGRRSFLRGLGGMALGLPLLEYTHGNAWARGLGAPKRFITVFSHGGTISNQGKTWRHDGQGSHHGEDLWRPADWDALTLGPIHESVQPHIDKLILIEGVDNKSAIEQDQYNAGAHGIANRTALTAGDQDEDGAKSPSIDQVIAERLAAEQPTPFERVHLSVHGHNYGTPYFRGANESMSGFREPQEAWASLFAGVAEDGEPSPEAQRLLSMRISALDGLLESYTEVKQRVGASDRHKIDAHLDHLRALEKELTNPVVCTRPDDPGDVGGAEHIGPLHVDLLVAAMRCGLANVGALEIGDILTPWTAAGNATGVGLGHSLGHDARDIGPTGPKASMYDTWFAEALDNRRWRWSLMRRLLDGLDDPNFVEADGGTLLDQSLVLFTSEFRNASGHYAYNMPLMLAGSAGGYFETGRFLDYNTFGPGPTFEYESQHSTHNLFTSILHAMGGDDAHFGNETAVYQGPLEGLV